MQLFIMGVSLSLFLLYALLILYYRRAWRSIPAYMIPKGTGGKQAVVMISVIIPARNEEKNLPALLRSLSRQHYDKLAYEVIVVDDHSTDGTASVVKNFGAGNIKLIRLEDHLNGQPIHAYKKKAIEVAITQSKGELIVTTDADCIVRENWLQVIAAFYSQHHPAFMVMPVCYTREPGFLPAFQSLDFMTLQGITGAAVSKHVHSMCNGANLAYTRKAYDAVEGFKGINDIASGDDMLLMHKVAKKYPTGIHYLKSTEVIVETAAMQNWSGFFNQRIRWASKADRYDDKSIFCVLLLVYCLNLIMLTLPILALVYNPVYSFGNYQLALFHCWVLLLIMKTIIELSFLFPVSVFFGKRQLLWLFPFAQPFHIIYTVIAGWLGKFGSYRWKERKVK